MGERFMEIEFRRVSFIRDGRTILRDVSFSLAEGETLVLLGASGSGKTTALRLVNALLMPTSGEVQVAGKATTAWDPIELRRSIGYVMQEHGLFPHMTVLRNVGLGLEILRRPQSQIDSRASALLEELKLPVAEFQRRYPRSLSGGQKQRAGIARALAIDPGLLLLDEPFGALDPPTRLELQHQFLDLRNKYGKASLFVTHDVAEALRVATRIGLLHNGTLELEATPAEFVRATHPVAQSFLRYLER
jgi:osmoprotectant transport system ATP-binding protein